MRILIVDDEPMMVRLLSRVLTARAGMSVLTVASGIDAQAALDGEAFDAVLADAAMGCMSGRELLTAVKARHPHVVRVLLSASPSHSDDPGLVHLYCSKPEDVESLAPRLRSLAKVMTLVADPRWRAEPGDVDGLPAAPATVLRLNQVLAAPRSSAVEVAATLESDPAMAARILQLASSAFFAPAEPVMSIEKAVARLGVDVVRALATSSALFTTVRAHADVLDVEALQATSLLTAQVASQLVASTRASQAAFGAGLLHAVGQLVLASRAPDLYRSLVRSAAKTHRRLADQELERLGFTDAELGAYLLGRWGLPAAIAEAVAHQDDEVRLLVSRVDVACAVRVAALLVRDALDPRSGSRAADLRWLGQLAARHRRDHWRALLDRLRAGAAAVRRRPRLAVSWPARIRTNGYTIEGVARDVTARGVFVAAIGPVRAGDAVEVELTLPRGQLAKSAGVIRWSGANVGHAVRGIGIELEAETPALRGAITGLTHEV